MLLFTTHGLLASLAKTPEVALAKPEAEMLAQAVVNVTQHYAFMSKVSAEAVAWANLAQCCALIYGPRVMAYKFNREAKKKAESETVINAAGMFGGGFPR